MWSDDIIEIRLKSLGRRRGISKSTSAICIPQNLTYALSGRHFICSAYRLIVIVKNRHVPPASACCTVQSSPRHVAHLPLGESQAR